MMSPERMERKVLALEDQVDRLEKALKVLLRWKASIAGQVPVDR